MIIPSHFHGPPTSGNGGYTCGLLADQTDFISEVTLRQPIPLDATMEVRREGDQLSLLLGNELIATVRPGQLDDLELPPTPPDFATAVAASKNYLGLREKLAFTTCFVCGTDRADDQGLHIYTGQVPGTATYAATWTPKPIAGDDLTLVPPRFIWAALDCPGAYAAMGETKLTLVLGRMTARIDRPLAYGEPCIIHAWPIGHEGRKHFSGTALYTKAGELVAVAKAIWFEI